MQNCFDLSRIFLLENLSSVVCAQQSTKNVATRPISQLTMSDRFGKINGTNLTTITKSMIYRIRMHVARSCDQPQGQLDAV